MSELENALLSLVQSVLWLSWQGTLLAVLVAAGLLVAGRRISAGWRYLAWSLITVRLLLFWGMTSSFSLYNSPLAVWPGQWAQSARVDASGVLPPQQQPSHLAEVGAPTLEPGMNTGSGFDIAENDNTSVPLVTGSALPARDPDVGPTAVGQLQLEPAETPSALSWALPVWTLLGPIWVAGMCIVTARIYRQQRQVNRILANAADAPGDITQLVAELVDSLGLMRSVRLRILRVDFGPAVSGLFRPTIYLPEWMLREFSREKLAMILRHELAHLKRWDLLAMWIMIAVRVVHWFNPMARWVLSRVQQECELACDERVSATLSFVDRKTYANVLLRVVERASQPPVSPMLLTFSRPAQQLKQRMEKISTYRRPTLPTHLAAACVICLLALMGLTNGFAETPAQSNKEVPQAVSPESRTPINEQEQGAPVHQLEQVAPSVADDKVVYTGICKNEQGDGIPGVNLQVYKRDGFVGPMRRICSSQTDDSGKFHIEILRSDFDVPEGLYSLVDLSVTSDQYASYQRRLRGDKSESDMEIQLKSRGKPLKGRVVDEGGTPRPGVWVFAYNSLRLPIPGTRSALTDEEGLFEIADAAFDNHVPYLATLHPEFPTVGHIVKGDTQQIELELVEGTTIEGDVIDDVTGKAIADCAVSAQSIDTGDGNFYQARTDATGRYRLLMPKDIYNIWAATADRMPVAIDSFPTLKGQTHQAPDVRMVRGGFVEGRVLDADTGKPVPRGRLQYYPIQVAHYGPARPRSGAAVTSTPVDEDGNYRLHLAPGDNYVYLMSLEMNVSRRSNDPNGNGVVPVADGETVELDFFVKVKAAYLLEESFVQTEMKVTKLLRELNMLQQQGQTGQLAWEQKMRELILLGPDAVPELCDALDATPVDNRLMLRSIPFILRGIGDKRAIPALIRTIPRCYGNDGSDMGYHCEDPELFAFLQKHDGSDRDNRNHYNYSRPVNEVFRTLERWTGVANGWHELAHISAGKWTPRQEQLKRQLFEDAAVRWDRWWKRHWKEEIIGAKWADVKVDLQEFKNEPPINFQLNLNKPLKRVSGRSGTVLQSLFNTKSELTFYDLDTGRWAGLPQQWRELGRAELVEKHDEIVGWAAREGFDLMGTEIQKAGEGFFVIETINLKIWEISEAILAANPNVSPQNMINAGRPVEKYVAHFDEGTGAYEYDQLGLFFFITSENTPGRLKLGVQVKDTNVIRGAPATGDEERNSKWFWKGRGFGLDILDEAN